MTFLFHSVAYRHPVPAPAPDDDSIGLVRRADEIGMQYDPAQRIDVPILAKGAHEALSSGG